MQIINKYIFVTLLVLLVLTSCERADDTIRHGDLSYDAAEVFGSGSSALAMAQAVGRGDVESINKIIADGAHVDVVGAHDITPLWWAAWAGNYSGFAALLDKGANPNVQRSDGLPIMNLVASNKDFRFLAAALKHGGDPNLLDEKSGEPPLVRPVMCGYNQNIDLLLAAKANVNWQSRISGETLPMIAIETRRDYQLVYKLFLKGADPTLRDHFGRSLVDIIEFASENASNNNDPWRAKVLQILKEDDLKSAQEMNSRRQP